MSTSVRPSCPCGQAHVAAVFNVARDEHDEWTLPDEVHAFATCTEIGEFLDTIDVTQSERCVEIMSSRASHHAEWLKKYAERQAVYDYWQNKKDDES